MPKSGKVVVLDDRLSIRKAFFALVFNSVRSAMVWHSATSLNVGLITISDFIHMLIAAYDTNWVETHTAAALAASHASVLNQTCNVRSLENGRYS